MEHPFLFFASPRQNFQRLRNSWSKGRNSHPEIIEIVPHDQAWAKIYKLEANTIKRNLAFRDWLKAHPEDLKAYEKLKYDLAKKHTDGMDYCRAKTEFISKIIDKALTLIK